MRGQFFKYWNRVRSGFWFVPAAMASGAVALALVSVTVDEPLTEWLTLNLRWTFTGGAEGASAVLGIIAGSMITIAGVVFSMTLVALSLASSQLGPRLLRNFMRDSTTQVVLGTFIATFLYCLLVLRTIRRAEEVAFVPHLSVTLGVLFAVASVGVLIYFIHHVSVSIQANEIAARISGELIERIDGLFPEHIGRGTPMIPTEPPDVGFLEAFHKDARPVGADGDGYLQFIDGEALLALAMEEDLVVRLERRPGNYVIASCPLALIWPGSRVTERLTDQVRSLFVLGHQRTFDQDIEFGVNQLVEIAVRALSPGLNDPFTAITCVDQLGSVLCRLATRDMPSQYRYDHQNQLRVIAPANTFPEITDAAFNQVRQYSRSSVAVTIRLLESIAVIAGFAHRPEDRTALLHHAEMIARGAIEGLPENEDLRAVEARRQAVIQLCSEAAASCR
ncbi:MAG TPA: DUF2254 domain-containing protein [Candidatus Limnocylindria bacterium]|nr:DUF2254 domain-containing protein [Candidatus Limnocylindria bacterium]